MTFVAYKPGVFLFLGNICVIETQNVLSLKKS